MDEIVMVDSLGKRYTKKSGRKEIPLEERLWPNIDKEAPPPAAKPWLGNCWLWTGRVSPRTGYVLIWFEGKYWRLHRLVYKLLVGELDPELVIGHKCNIKHCCRPSHLEQVTVGKNTRDAIADGLRKPGPYSKEVMS